MANNKGTVIQVMGPVLDIRFADDQLPKLLNAILVKNGENTITLSPGLQIVIIAHIIPSVPPQVTTTSVSG